MTIGWRILHNLITKNNNKMTTEVTCVKLKDIKDKDLLYIVISNGKDKEAINVGTKTWERVNKILNPKQKELPLNYEKNKP